MPQFSRQLAARPSAVLLMVHVVWIFNLVACAQFLPVPSVAEVERLQTSFPNAVRGIRTEFVDVPDIVVRYAFDTTSIPEDVLTYYHSRLTSHGFRVTNPWGGARPADKYYVRVGCPTYGFLIDVDAPTQHVVTEFSRTPCR